MDEKLKKTLDLIKVLAAKNKDFEAELQKLYGGTSSANTVLMDNVDIKDPISTGNDKIDSIYELCVEKVLQEQAEQFYKDFPIEEIRMSLIQDFKYMELYKRRDDFLKFCESTYQQIECIVNWFSQNNDFINLFSSTLDLKCSLDNDEQTIGDFIINNPPNQEYKKLPICSPKFFFNHKLRAVLFHIYYKCKPGTAFVFNTKFYEINDLINCRHKSVHREGSENPYQKELVKNILLYRYMYYLKFTSILVDFIEHIQKFYYEKEFPGKIIDIQLEQKVGKIELSDTNTILKISGNLFYQIRKLSKGDAVKVIKYISPSNKKGQVVRIKYTMI